MEKQEKIIVVDNPTGLPLAKLDDFVLFQGDLKMPISDPAMKALKTSILEHRVFIGKAVAWFNDEMLTEDGHQTLQALKSLRDEDGYVRCQVISYAKKEGNMVEDGSEEFDNIMVPYQIVVPQGRDDFERKKDAAAKIAIINSQYAAVSPNTTFFTSLGFELADIERLQAQIRLPELSFVNFAAFSNVAKPSTSGGKATGDGTNFNEKHDEFLPDDEEEYAEEGEEETMDSYPNRVIIVFQDAEQKQWLETKLGQALVKVITPVSVLMENATDAETTRETPPETPPEEKE